MGDDGPTDERAATSPGEAVRAAMERLGWTQSDLAFVLGVTTATINQIVTGRRGLSHNMAKALGHALGIPAQTLAVLQAERELQQAEEPAPIVSARARILSQYPLREMVKRGWIPETNEPAVLLRGVCKFFDAPTLNDVPCLAYAARKSGDSGATPAQQAWIFRVRQIAREMPCPAFSAAKLDVVLNRLADVRGEPEGVRHVPRLMQEAGVRFVIVEDLPGSEIDGVCLWLSDKSPVIGMSLIRQNRQFLVCPKTRVRACVARRR